MFQLPVNDQEPMLNIMKDRKEDYKDVPFIIRGSALAKGNIDFDDERLQYIKDKKPYFLNEYPLHSRCSIDISLLIDYMHALGFLEHGTVAKFVPKWRGTLGLLVSMGYQMGYKNIVLCGMDMQDNHHFWDHPDYLEKSRKFNLPASAPITAMTDKDRSPNTVPEYMYALNRWMKEQSGTEIFVADPQTVLYPKIRVYEG